ncbi:unnamed protein product [Amoebophrya sp. A120]|nr:unnamed protein product [Amoebophrya sp. A120]|eukprot:GSA120T00018248001.1
MAAVSQKNLPSPPFILVVGRPQRSKKTFVNWCCKEEVLPPNNQQATLRPTKLEVAQQVGRLEREILDDILVEQQMTSSTTSVASSGGASTSSSSTAPEQDSKVAQRAVESRGPHQTNEHQTSSSSSSSSSSRGRTPPFSTTTSMRTLPIAACLEPAKPTAGLQEGLRDLGNPSLVLLPLLSIEEQRAPALWCDVSKVRSLTGPDAAVSQQSKSLASSLLAAGGELLSVGQEEDQGEDDGEEHHADDTNYRKGKRKRDVVKQKLTSAMDTTKMMLQMTGVNQLMEKSNLLVRSAVSDATSTITGLGNQLLSQMSEADLLGAFESPDEARLAWRNLVEELASKAAAILFFVSEKDLDMLKATDILQLLLAMNKSEELGAGGDEVVDHDELHGEKSSTKLRIYIPKWDLKSATQREMERSAIRTAVFDQLKGGSGSASSQAVPVRPVGFEQNRETFMFDDLPAPENLIWKGKKVVSPDEFTSLAASAQSAGLQIGGAISAGAGSSSKLQKHSFALCRDVVREAVGRAQLSATQTRSAPSTAAAKGSSKSQFALQPNRQRVQDFETWLETEAKRRDAAKKKEAEESRRSRGEQAGRGNTDDTATNKGARNAGAGGPGGGGDGGRVARGRSSCCSCWACCKFCWRHGKFVSIAFFVLILALVVRRNLGWLLR